MEVSTNKKLLHHHIVPMAVLSVGVFIVSVMGAQRLLSSSNGDIALHSLFSAHVFKVTQGSNGLAHIELYHVTEDVPSTPAPTGLDVTTNLGKSAQLNATITSLTQQ